MVSTVLVSMPFVDASRPSIQLGLLSAIAADNGYAVQTLHAGLDLAARIGPDHYDRLAQQRGAMIGDWLFSVEAFGDRAPDPDGELLDRLDAELRQWGQDPARTADWLRSVRDKDIPAYLDHLLDSVDWSRVRYVGFTVSFQQAAASFALARRLKARHPQLIMIFGGANFDGEMGLELVRSVDCIDVAVIGEADQAFPALLAALERGDEPGQIPGVVSRLSGTIVATTPAPVRDLADSPVPDYAEYFQRAERLGLLGPGRRRATWLPIETARGCWWGAKHHCVFCGLNATTMEFRAKPADRVLSDLAELARRNGTFRFSCVDNILDVSYLTKLFPALIESGLDFEFFWEVKANLDRDQLRLLRQAGVSRIQPGIESLSSAVLAAMRKGVTAAQNVNVLRWARYYGIDVAWNLLWGLPGESAGDYAAQTRLVHRLHHLQPPDAEGRVWLERFSPMFTELPATAFRHRAPELSYRYVYPDTTDLDKIAYFFDFELADQLAEETFEPLRQANRVWRTAWRDGPPELTYWYAPGYLQVFDSRNPLQRQTTTFDGPPADVYLACTERPRNARAIGAELGIDAGQVDVWLREFAESGLLMLDGDRALSLALPATPGR